MFSHITQNWRGSPLISHEVITNLITHTTTHAGLKIRAELDRGIYPIGLKITDAELTGLNLKLVKFHGNRPASLEKIANVIALQELPTYLDRALEGRVRGRTIVQM